jgi:hypothetical protein
MRHQGYVGQNVILLIVCWHINWSFLLLSCRTWTRDFFFSLECIAWVMGLYTMPYTQHVFLFVTALYCDMFRFHWTIIRQCLYNLTKIVILTIYLQFYDTRNPNYYSIKSITHNRECNRPLCGLVVRVPGYRTEMYCVSCEVRTEFIYVMFKKLDRICGLVVRVPGCRTKMYCVSCEVRTEFIYVM